MAWKFRQLSSLLRTALVMADAGHEIGLRRMPDDFFDNLAEMHQLDGSADSLPACASAPGWKKWRIRRS